MKQSCIFAALVKKIHIISKINLLKQYYDSQRKGK
jgi:hypothetical protein